MHNRVHYSAVNFFSSTNLLVIKEYVYQNFRLFEQYGHSNLFVHQFQFKRNVERLLGIQNGQEEISCSNTMTAQVKEILQNPKHTGSIVFNYQKMYIHYMFREFEDMKVYAEQYFHVNCESWVLYFTISVHKFFGGLIAFWVYRQTNDIIGAERGQAACWAFMADSYDSRRFAR